VLDYPALHADSLRDPARFWAAAAAEIEWSREWESVLSSEDAPFRRWYEGGIASAPSRPYDEYGS
jgi:hypothetical protein